MNLRFHPHAVERMQERRLSVAAVELVIAAADGKIRQSRDKWIFHKKIGRADDAIAVVVVGGLADEWIDVITVLVNFNAR